LIGAPPRALNARNNRETFVSSRVLALAVAGALTVASAFAFTAPTAQAAELEKVKMSVAANSLNYAPYFIPIDKGYFKEEGFEVELVEAGGGVATPAQISGQIDFNTSASAALSAMLRGAPLKIVYFPWDKTIYQLWTSDPNIKTLADMKGKQVGILSRGDTFEVAMRLTLMRAGLDPNSVGYSALGVGSARRAALVAGSLPIVIISPEDVEWLKTTGKIDSLKLIYDMYPDIGMPLAGTSVRTADLEKDRNRVKRFLRAVHKGMIYAMTYRAETVDLVTRYAKAPSRDTFDAAYHYTVKTRTADGSVSPELQRQETDLRADLINLPRDKLPPLEKLYDFGPAKEVWAELQNSGWKPQR
jgi:NitT/TauT family transport system substrate-binding protein